MTRNVEEVIDRAHLEKELKSGKKLRVKLGIDPTGGNLHIGHAVTYWKLKEFQALGHKLVIIIGDFTAQIGDPSDKLEKRPFLSKAQVEKNLKNYLPQIGKIVDIRKAEVHRNSEWLAGLNFRETAELAESFSFQQIVKRRNFQERIARDEDITLRELMYPLMQGYDSVAVKADVELGGSDQLFNLTAGRRVQKHYGQKPQDIMTMKMLVGLDGRKMSKSWGNVINIADSADEQFGKVMSMHDDYIMNYLELATDLSMDEIKKLGAELKKGTNPKKIKEKLAFEIVRRYHGEKSARDARDTFGKLFSKKEIPADVPALKLPSKHISIREVVLSSGVAKSKSEARRLIEQGAVEVNGSVINNPAETILFKGGEILKVGKRKFFRVKV